MNHVILFFIDGLGIGEKNENNPLARFQNLHPLDNFVGQPSKNLLGGKLRETDARLGVAGRPQSASGHTTIYTGKNASKINGSHRMGFPNEKLRDLIRDHSIFKQLAVAGIDDYVFINAYTPNFFAMKKPPRSATTVMIETSNAEFRKLPDLLGKKALFHDFTNRRLIEKGFNVPEFSPASAAEILVDVASLHNLTVFEYFMTDKIGHAMDWKAAERCLSELASLLRNLVKRIDFENTTLILTSDHGNIENLSIRNHTLNKVPTIIWGRESKEIAEQIDDLTDISRAILRLLTV